MTATSTTPVAEWRADLDDYVHVLEVSPRRDQAVVGSLGGDAALIDPDDGAATPLQGHEMGVLSAAWSSDGALLAVGGQDGTVHIYDRAGTAKASVEVSNWVTAMAWSSAAPILAIGAGRHLLVVDGDGTVLEDFDDQPSTVTAVAWSTDGTRIGAAAYGGIGWHDVLGKRAGRRLRFDWKGSLLSLEMSPDGKWVCAGAQDASVHIWKLWNGRDLTMGGYDAKIERIAFRHDTRWLAVACLGELSVWDFGGRGPAGRAPAAASGHEKHIEDLAWSPVGDLVATGGADGRTIVWGAPTKAGRDLKPVTAFESNAATSRLRWVDDNSFLVGRADGGLVRLDI